jgi:hypothetical protein
MPARALLAAAFIAPLPVGALLAGGWRIRTATANFQAADDFGAPYLCVEEWLAP